MALPVPELEAGELRQRPIVFLHIPKTAGQTIHHALAYAVGGEAHVSPVRVNHQVARDVTHLPPGYRLYSGHIDWIDLDTLDNPFSFTVLRDPRERIASFYFFMLKEAQALNDRDPDALKERARKGMRLILTRSAEDYFLRGDKAWRAFIANNYSNFYTKYFATGRYNGLRMLDGVTRADRLAMAREALATRISGVYGLAELARLEADLSRGLGARLKIAKKYSNVGSIPRREPRWPLLMAQLESDKAVARLESFVEMDLRLIESLNLQV